MALHTRRQVLRTGGAALVAALAGCSGESSSRSSSPPETVAPDTLVTEYDLLQLRHDSPEPIFRDASRDGSGSDFPAFLVGERSELDAVEFAATPPGTDDARRFLSETTFEEAALVVVQHRVGACRTARLQYVASTPERVVDLEFCYVLRDASVECSVDDTHAMASLVRLPFSLADRDDRSWGYGGGGRCRPVPESPRTDSPEAS